MFALPRSLHLLASCLFASLRSPDRFPYSLLNWTSPNATEDGHAEAGLPKAFLDKTYVHPITGEVRLNPLRYAVAKDGKSKACHMKKHPVIDRDCKYIQRDSVLYTTGDDCREAREEKYAKIGLYQRQVVNALMWPVFSAPEGRIGMPWNNIPSFNPPPPDTSYPNRCDFDGIYEQPHDNIHGWIGIDMADNAYTAFDPIFWAHHANLDRILRIGNESI